MPTSTIQPVPPTRAVAELLLEPPATTVQSKLSAGGIFDNYETSLSVDMAKTALWISSAVPHARGVAQDDLQPHMMRVARSIFLHFLHFEHLLPLPTITVMTECDG